MQCSRIRWQRLQRHTMDKKWKAEHTDNWSIRVWTSQQCVLLRFCDSPVHVTSSTGRLVTLEDIRMLQRTALTHNQRRHWSCTKQAILRTSGKSHPLADIHTKKDLSWIHVRSPGQHFFVPIRQHPKSLGEESGKEVTKKNNSKLATAEDKDTISAICMPETDRNSKMQRGMNKKCRDAKDLESDCEEEVKFNKNKDH